MIDIRDIDVQRLHEGDFLNDVIIAFYLASVPSPNFHFNCCGCRYLADNLPPTPKVYFLSSFFMNQMETKEKGASFPLMTYLCASMAQKRAAMGHRIISLRSPPLAAKVRIQNRPCRRCLLLSALLLFQLPERVMTSKSSGRRRPHRIGVIMHIITITRPHHQHRRPPPSAPKRLAGTPPQQAIKCALPCQSTKTTPRARQKMAHFYRHRSPWPPRHQEQRR